MTWTRTRNWASQAQRLRRVRVSLKSSSEQRVRLELRKIFTTFEHGTWDMGHGTWDIGHRT